jgi:phosphopantothenoylcysteine decarboxylase/phosphopantothenate--cysteine ligase
VGFAAETQDVLNYASGKLTRKGLDLIVANDVSDDQIGFNSDQNEVTLIWADGSEALARASKQTLADQIMTTIGGRFSAKVKNHK